MKKIEKKNLLRAYGLNEIALVPSDKTIHFDLVTTKTKIADLKLETPIIASAMDSVVNPKTASLIDKFGGVGVLNLEGVQTRYDNCEKILKEIANIPKKHYVNLMQKLYNETSIKKELVIKRIKELKSSCKNVVVSATPQSASWLGPIAAEAGANSFLIQSTVISTNFKTNDKSQNLDLKTFCQEMPIPIMVGNATTYSVALDLMRTGIKALFVGIGPGAACTTRGVLGIGVPMATTIIDTAHARDQHLLETGEYISIVADGGIVNSGDICKAIACGADAVMIGSPLAKAIEAPGNGFHWGMATPNAVLPRGARIEVGQIASLEEIFIGPSNTDDGSQNLNGAIKTCMATLGAENIKEMHNIEIVIAPSLLTEGKVYQQMQSLGMYKS